MKKSACHIAALGLALLLCACAQKGLYQWNGYDKSLYDFYDKPESAEQFRLQLETHLNTLEQRKDKIPPGLYAELGTLYLQKGDRETALRWYDKERSAWPESKYLMDTMILAVGKQKQEDAK